MSLNAKNINNGMKSFLQVIKNTYEKNWSNNIISGNKLYGGNGKEKVVILGSGWGGINFLKNIDFHKYDVTLISPRSYFTFTPLLPCMCSGTLSINSCTESVRKFLRQGNSRGNYLQLECTDILPEENAIKCQDKEKNEIKINYDYLIIAVGAKTNSFNIKGVEEYAFYIKEVDDALKIRKKLLQNLEKCSLPNITEEEKKKLLHIAVVGGGPTGVEVAAELADFIQKEVKRDFEDIYKYISISIIEGGKKLLPSFSESISDFTKENFRNQNVNVLTNYYVVEINEKEFIIQSSIDKNDRKVLLYGIIVWASGLAQRNLINNFLKKIPQQINNKILTVNSQLIVTGISAKNIYAIGDCKRIVPLQLHDYANEIIRLLNSSKITSNELKEKSEELANVFPQLCKSKWDFEKNPKGEMNEEELKQYLTEIDNNYKSPAPTAQNARQEAKYLSNIFNNYLTKQNKLFVPSFREMWKGSLAYIGNHEAVASLPFGEIKGGFFSFIFWKTVYAQMLLTWKSRFVFIFDFLKARFHGRSFVN